MENTIKYMMNKKVSYIIHWVPMEQAFKMLESGKTKFPKASENIKYNEIFDTVRNAYKNVYLKRNSNKVKRDIVE